MNIFGWIEVKKDNDTQDRHGLPLGPYALAGPAPRPDPRTTPLRGDIAHIALAGRYFVPHYVVPLQRMAGDMGATLYAAPDEKAEIIDGLAPGQRFDLLDTAGDWAWGCLSPRGPVGYVALADLVDPLA